MASKSINVDIDGKEIPVLLSRIKKREVKEFVGKIAGKADEITKLFAKFSNDDNKEKADASTLIYENIDFICDEIIKPFTSLSSEQIDEMDVYEVALLAKDWLDYNGINTDAIKNFLKQNIFASFFPAEGATPQQIETMNFNGMPIPPLRK